MKKTLILFGMILLISVSLINCGGEKKEEVPEEPQAQIEAPAETEISEAPAEPVVEEQAETKATASTTDFRKSPLKGNVVSFNDLVIGKSGEVSKSKALKLFKKGHPIVFKGANGKVYFVYNADGSFAGKKLALLAGKKNIAVYGKVKKVDNLNILIADKFENVK